jgi:small subunit ribosomal protein S15
MAKMHSRKRGNAGSKKPLHKTKPSWLRVQGKELEMLIVKLAKEGKSASHIGLELRDSYGVPDVKTVHGKRITQVLAEKGHTTKLPEDLLALMKRAAAIRKHLEENRQDMPALRGMQLTDAKIKRLVKYYKATGKLPIDFKYDPAQLKLYTQ